MTEAMPNTHSSATAKRMELKKANHGRRISGIFLPVAIFREEKFRENKEVDSTTNRAADTLDVPAARWSLFIPMVVFRRPLSDGGRLKSVQPLDEVGYGVHLFFRHAFDYVFHHAVGTFALAGGIGFQLRHGVVFVLAA